MSNYIRLEQTEVLADRPFTHPGRSLDDWAMLAHMLACLRQVVEGADRPAGPPPHIFHVTEADGSACRVVLANRGPLLAENDLVLIGFFSEKPADLDPELAAHLAEVDDELIAEFPRHPGVLSYSSLVRPNGTGGNLVVLAEQETAEHWRTSEKHAYAVRELTPKCYTSIRLHNGRLSGGLPSANAPVLIRTKYYAFDGGTPWQAVREFSAA